MVCIPALRSTALRNLCRWYTLERPPLRRAEVALGTRSGGSECGSTCRGRPKPPRARRREADNARVLPSDSAPNPWKRCNRASIPSRSSATRNTPATVSYGNHSQKGNTIEMTLEQHVVSQSEVPVHTEANAATFLSSKGGHLNPAQERMQHVRRQLVSLKAEHCVCSDNGFRSQPISSVRLHWSQNSMHLRGGGLCHDATRYHLAREMMNKRGERMGARMTDSPSHNTGRSSLHPRSRRSRRWCRDARGMRKGTPRTRRTIADSISPGTLHPHRSRRARSSSGPSQSASFLHCMRANTRDKESQVWAVRTTQKQCNRTNQQQGTTRTHTNAINEYEKEKQNKTKQIIMDCLHCSTWLDNHRLTHPNKIRRQPCRPAGEVRTWGSIPSSVCAFGSTAPDTPRRCCSCDQPTPGRIPTAEHRDTQARRLGTP